MNFKETIRSDLKVKLTDMKLVYNGETLPIVIDSMRYTEDIIHNCTEYEIMAHSCFGLRQGKNYLQPKHIIFHNPATVIYWEDGTKTVIKCQPGDTYDKEKGVALCYMKKMLGNTAREFNKALKKWVK